MSWKKKKNLSNDTEHYLFFSPNCSSFPIPLPPLQFTPTTFLTQTPLSAPIEDLLPMLGLPNIFFCLKVLSLLHLQNFRSSPGALELVLFLSSLQLKQKRWLIAHIAFRHNWDQLVQNVTGAGQRTKGTVFAWARCVSQKGVATVRRVHWEVLDSRHAVQRFVPVSLASNLPYFCSCAFYGCTS